MGFKYLTFYVSIKCQLCSVLLGCRHESAVYFGVDEKFSPGGLILLKNADVIELKCSVGILAKL